MRFDHQHAVPGVASDATLPFGPGGPQWPVRDAYSEPISIPPGIVQVPTMNAVHMALIPTGVHRGKVIVWGIGPQLAFAPGFPPVGDLWSWQPYAIVDPAVNPEGLRFLNFFLPLDHTPLTANPLPVPTDLFCAGHAWSPFGYLVVAGGTRYVPGVPDNGADVVFTFDPRYANAPFPVAGVAQLYPDSGSRWTRENVTLGSKRYYPTVTLTHRVPRAVSGLPTQVETMLVLGGSRVGGGVPVPEWLHYEALIVADLSPSNTVRIRRDEPILGQSTWWGPSNSTLPSFDPFRDSFVEYPRCHLLSNGRVFMSGYAPVSAQIDHGFIAGTTLPSPQIVAFSQSWNQAWGVPSTTSPYREDGSSVLIVNGTAIPDLVIKIGGEDINQQAVSSVEICSGTGASFNTWTSASVPQLAEGREHPTAVILPDLSIAVFGGHDGATNHLHPVIFKWGTGYWQVQPDAPMPMSYHTTAILTPSGAVLLAGGNSRHPAPDEGADYALFAPSYMSAARPSAISIDNPTSVQADGTYQLARAGAFSLSVEQMPIDTKMEKLVLISPGSSTHHSDMHQRYVECTVISVNDTQMWFTLPTEKQAPRGFYMAFVVTQSRIPSEAVWVWLQ